MTVTLTRIISGDIPVGVELETLVRNDNGHSPISVPDSFTMESGGDWQFTFTDPAGTCPSGYTYTYLLNWSDGSYSGPFKAEYAGSYPLIPATLITQMPGTNVYFYMTALPAGSGYAFDGTTQVVMSDSSGLAAFELIAGATYNFQIRNGPPTTVVVPSSGSIVIPNVLGL